MTHTLRAVARRIRDKARKTPPPVLAAALAATVLAIIVVPLVIVAVLAPVTVTVVLVGIISAATTAVVAAMWVNLARQWQATRAANARIEVAQRRILAAIEQQRLDAERRESVSV
ncbi:hypothetical protein LX16_0137 [Stackebrandtia albiflava]|uniref:Uncharacterized protein n=1 Tax=Stackebrandtia albiflava TaxID=406432 RepID=A0A562VGB6_9ACTN|nr:hypothetical protein [Stackebrandtia albiflava]TWJ16922.1 hypothetical protein LX16_0137 [Stackebrandtia albiflava]